MSDVEKLLSRERMLRLRESHLKREAQRCHQEADELRRAAWFSEAGAISDGGMVAGVYRQPDGRQHAVVWRLP